MILRSRRFQNRSELRSSTGPGQALSVVTGLMKSLVTRRFFEKSASMPCGLNWPSSGLVEGYSPTRLRFRSNSTSLPPGPPEAEPMLVTRKPPPGSGRKSSVMLEFGALVENMNFGWRPSVMSKKKMLFCPLSRLRRPPQARIR